MISNCFHSKWNHQERSLQHLRAQPCIAAEGPSEKTTAIMNSSAYQISYRRSESARPDSDNTDSTNKPCALRVPLDVRPSELTEPCLFYFHGGTENQPKSTEKKTSALHFRIYQHILPRRSRVLLWTKLSPFCFPIYSLVLDVAF